VLIPNRTSTKVASLGSSRSQGQKQEQELGLDEDQYILWNYYVESLRKGHIILRDEDDSLDKLITNKFEDILQG
jgi:hypothetical protein